MSSHSEQQKAQSNLTGVEDLSFDQVYLHPRKGISLTSKSYKNHPNLPIKALSRLAKMRNQLTEGVHALSICVLQINK
jgi:hypothetical protein